MKKKKRNKKDIVKDKSINKDKGKVKGKDMKKRKKDKSKDKNISKRKNRSKRIGIDKGMIERVRESKNKGEIKSKKREMVISKKMKKKMIELCDEYMYCV